MNVDSLARKYGMYAVGDREFALLQDAINFVANDHTKIRFAQYDKKISQLDVSQDPFPNLTLNDLYRIRAQEIRDSYDYVVLSLSGGPDSSNILDTFVKNNIYLDEIINFNSYARNGKLEGANNNADYVYNVAPKIRELQKNPAFKTKITVLDEVDTAVARLNQIYIAGKDEFLKESGGLQRWNCVAGHLVEAIPHVFQMIKEGKKVALISGVDKPVSRMSNGKRYLIVSDNLRGKYIEWLFENQLPSFWEWFYQGDIRIFHKQCYLLQKFVEQHPDSQYYDREQSDPTLRFANQWPSADGLANLKYEWFHAVIYPGLKLNFVTLKDADIILMPRHIYYLSSIDKKLQQMYYQTMVKYKAQPDSGLQSKGVKYKWHPGLIKSPGFRDNFNVRLYYDKILLQ